MEKYMDKCISSIVNQTYTNLEIILINDGSTDNTGVLCDSWQERDNRIRVIHKQNEGLAYARKTGVENTTADYVTFVDGDDWIHVDMYSNMMAAILSTNSEIAQCGVCMVFEDGQKKHLDSELITGAFEIVSRIDGVLLILGNDKWHSWMWNKIFKKNLFDGVDFLKGNSYAEDFISVYLFHKANQSVYFQDEYCYYFQRNDSITGSTNIPKQLKNQYDFFFAWHDRYYFVKNNPEYHNTLSSIKMYVFGLGIHLMRNIIVFPKLSTANFNVITKQIRAIPLKKEDKLHISLKIDYYILKFAGAKSYKLYRKLYITILKITNFLKITNHPPYTLLSNMWGCLGIWK